MIKYRIPRCMSQTPGGLRPTFQEPQIKWWTSVYALKVTWGFWCIVLAYSEQLLYCIKQVGHHGWLFSDRDSWASLKNTVQLDCKTFPKVHCLSRL